MTTLFKNPFAPTNRAPFQEFPVSHGTALPSQYGNYARAYSGNEIVFACIKMLADSVGEPHIVGRKFQRNSPEIRNEEKRLLDRGVSLRDAQARMIQNGFFKDLPTHPLIKLLDNPNPWMSRGDQWGHVVMDRALAGNAYLLKARWPEGPLAGTVAELWRLRPDRVKIIPSKTDYIEAYEYNAGRDTVKFPPEDIIHFKTRNPHDNYYGMPTVLPILSRVAIDEYMRGFLRTFFERGGTGPGAILTVKQKVTPADKDAIRERFGRQFGLQGGFHELMVLDQAESSYQNLGLDRGLRDALPKELDAVTEARIAMVFGIPGSLVGLLIAYNAGSGFAGKRSDWQVFWKLTMTPLLADMAADLNRQLVPDFGNIDEVLFNLADIWALQEDVDKLHERARQDYAAGGLGFKEFRELIGRNPALTDDVLMVPRLSVPTPVEQLGEVLLPDAAERAPKVEVDEEAERVPEAQDFLASPVLAEVHHKCGRLIAKEVMGDPELYCGKCKVTFRPHDVEPGTVTKKVLRDEEGRIAEVVEVRS
jgi:HK97 family phage portal protein